MHNSEKIWHIACNDVEKSLAQWGIDSTNITTANQVPDVMSLSTAKDYKGAAIFPYGSTVDLYRIEGGVRTREFSGRVSTMSARSLKAVTPNGWAAAVRRSPSPVR